MKSLNKVFLLGRVGQTPELLKTKAGQPYTRLSVATRRHGKNEDDKWQELTDWHLVTAWGTLARICTQGISKGALVFVEGQLNPYSVANAKGESEIRYSIQAQKVSFLSLSPKEVATASAATVSPA